MRRIVERVLMGALVAAICLCAGDWLVFRYRMARGSAYDTVRVAQVIASPLKNGKEEYDYAGTQPMECVRTILPWAGDKPCWWLRRHTEQIE
jgi:hypothetical protein